MINASEARKLSLNNGKAEAIAKCKKWTEDSIRKAIENGRTETCFANTGSTVNGVHYDCEDELREWLLENGYHFKPTGYIGGVWQRTEEICW